MLCRRWRRVLYYRLYEMISDARKLLINIQEKFKIEITAARFYSAENSNGTKKKKN